MAAAGREVAGAAGAARAVGLGLLAAALAVAAVAVVSGPHVAPEPVLAAAAPQSCPPVRLPCTPRARCWRRAAHARLRACVRARLRACVPACLRACAPACLRARVHVLWARERWRDAGVLRRSRAPRCRRHACCPR